MARITECPSCGGPIIDGGGEDLRCANCGMTYLELVDEFGEDVDLDEEFVGEESEAIELGYGQDEIDEGSEPEW